jgi:hypothetical protein
VKPITCVHLAPRPRTCEASPSCPLYTFHFYEEVSRLLYFVAGQVPAPKWSPNRRLKLRMTGEIESKTSVKTAP